MNRNIIDESQKLFSTLRQIALTAKNFQESIPRRLAIMEQLAEKGIKDFEANFLSKTNFGIPKEKIAMSDNVNHPPHYNQGKIEVIEFIKDKNLNYECGNVVKYICRAGIKDPRKELEDLEKAAWYLAYHIEQVRAKKENREPRRPNDLHKPKILEAQR